jgi:hypothetical protein
MRALRGRGLRFWLRGSIKDAEGSKVIKKMSYRFEHVGKMTTGKGEIREGF